MTFVLRRHAARVICFDAERRVLLINSVDPADPGAGDWWELPGGGIDGGETPQDACRRELAEEAGVRDADVGAQVFTNRALFTFSGWDFDQREEIFVATCSGASDDDLRLEAFEAAAFRGSRWWPVDELIASGVRTVPVRLLEFIGPVASGEIPDTPIDITPPGDEPDD